MRVRERERSWSLMVKLLVQPPGCERRDAEPGELSELAESVEGQHSLRWM